jgi:hypothetical protein
MMDAPTQTPSALFDYSALDHAVANEARQAAAAIKSRFQASIIETGRDLARIRATLPSRTFSKWLDAEFGMTERTARNYISAAGMVDALPQEKAEIVSALPPTAIYALATPAITDEARTEIIERVVAGQVSDLGDIRSTVAKARQVVEDEAKADRKAKRRAKLTPEEIASAERKERARQRKIDAQQEQYRQERQTREAAAHGFASFIASSHTGADRAKLLELLTQTDSHSLMAALRDALGERVG